MQLQLDTKKSYLMAFLILYAFSSLGFAVFGLILGPEEPLGLDKRHQLEVRVLLPKLPELEPWAEFWHGAGYRLFRRDQNSELLLLPSRAVDAGWVQSQEEWVLVPERPGLELTAPILQLCSALLSEGWALQLEQTEHGYSLGFWSTAEGSEQRVLALDWRIEQLNPHNYRQYAAGVVPVLGELFDPAGYLKGTAEAPVLAIIIDDWGHNSPAADPLLAFPLPLTVAVLPQLDLTAQLAERAHAAGHEVILHQPMEALDTSLALGPGGIYTGMDPAEVRAKLEENLADLPMAVGVSNHMGSLVTEDPAVMRSILETVDELGLFFVDSRTSSRSVVSAVAAEMGVPYGANDLFLDNESDVEKIQAQLQTGLQRAQRQGQAVVISHVRPATAEALWGMIPELLSSGVELVPISRVLHAPQVPAD